MQKGAGVAKLVVLVSAAFLGGALAASLATASTERQSPYFILDQLARVLVRVENDYVDPVERNRLIEGAIKGMVSALDPHSAYLPSEEYAVMRGDTEGRFGGVGVEVDFADDQVTVIAVVEGSPAERGGVQPSDQIIAIDNKPVRGKQAGELVRLMRGEPGTRVVVTLRREGRNKPVVVNLVREIISVASISQKLLAEDVGYIRIKSFQAGTHREFLAALGELRKASQGSLRGVILDLRNNPGGLVHEAARVGNELLDSGVIYTTRHRGNIVDEVRSGRGGALTTEPLVTLVNEFSASAAELVAGALQDAGRSQVVGAKTFGKGSVQSIIELPGGAGLKLTTMRYYTPRGRAIQALGITPDLPVKTPAAPGNIVREADLDGHLEAEGPQVSPAPGEGGTQSPEGQPSSSDTHLGVARVIPFSPLDGPDRALSVAFKLLTGRHPRR
jgi:carboxyl-terminal processing protease